MIFDSVQVKYNTPSRSVTDDDGDSISHLEWETVRVSFGA